MSEPRISHRRRVVILGGGAGGLAAAFRLSQPGWHEHFEDITVYQLGWRLGGKGASGRGHNGRIEEHGLHVWLGFYHNAFQMMRECYAELDRPASCPISTIEEAFERASLFVVEEERPEGWLPWPALFPISDRFPGRDGSLSLWHCLIRALELALAFVRSTATTDFPPATAPHLVPVVTARPPLDAPVLTPAFDPIAVLVRSARAMGQAAATAGGAAVDAALAGALALAMNLDSNPFCHTEHDRCLLLQAVEAAADQACETISRGLFESDELRRDWFLFDVLLACVRGVIFHRLLTRPEGLEAIDGFDFVDWLELNGASSTAARSPMLKTVVYDMAFAYRDGDPCQPSASAASALEGVFRLFFDYEGAIAWKMRAGMGDIAFAPLYEVLRQRGVRFEFFHRVDALHLDASGNRVERIDIGVQVEVRDRACGYQPLVDVKGLPCWPNAPLIEQLTQQVTAADVESFWSTWTDAGSVTLHDGKDFDEVVLAIPVGALRYICEDIIRHDPVWARMVDKLATVNTQSFQLWLRRPMNELGMPGPPATLGGYLEPFDTIADMRQLITQEDWPPGSVQSIAYFCNTMPTTKIDPDDRGWPARASDEVRANAISFLNESMLPIWPGAVNRYPTEFNWDLLVGPSATEPERSGERPAGHAFDTQYWRANIDPWERYVLSLPGTMTYRLHPYRSGYENLTLAGDWTRCGLNAGYVESAVTAGMVAANHLRGRPHLEGIVTFGGL